VAVYTTFEGRELSMTTHKVFIMMNQKEQRAIDKAIRIIESKALVSDVFATSIENVSRYCQLHIASAKSEQFGVLFLNSQHALIKFEVMFYGTLGAASVYPREVARRALELNAASTIFTHNHPSNSLTASEADKAITKRLVTALSTLDIKVLDHIIVSQIGTMSFAQTGLL
jgi:DNA repair protein RadC